MSEPTIEVGTKVKIGRKQFEVAWVGKEVKLADKAGETLWRHSRTVARLLVEQEAKPKRRRKETAAKGDEQSGESGEPVAELLVGSRP